MPPSPLVTPRAVAALVLGAAASALGGLILGEYDFSGATPYAAGLLFGLVVADLVLEVGKLRSWLVGLVAAACVAAGLGWAAWISSGEGLRPFPLPAWAAMAIGALTCAWRAGRAPRAASDGADAVDAPGMRE